MAIFALILNSTTKGATLDFTLALFYLVLTITCEALLVDSGLYNSLNYMPYYRGAMWSAAVVWTLVSGGRLWFYASKPILNETSSSMRDLVKNFFKNRSKDTRKCIGFTCLWVFVFFTVMPTTFSSIMASVVLCAAPNMVDETKNCTIWESTESKRIATGTLLIAQALVPGILVLIPVCFSILFVIAVCKMDCCDDDDD